jgi:hypothetical protein
MKKSMLFSWLFIVSALFTATSEAKAFVNSDSKPQVDKTEQLFKAVGQANIGKVKSLLKARSYKIEINRLNKDQQTVLDIAVDCRATKVAAELMKYGAKVTSEENAQALREMFKMRAVKFFVGGLFLWPLWIGSFFALDNMSCIKILFL